MHETKRWGSSKRLIVTSLPQGADIREACGDPMQPGQVEYELNYPDEQRTFRLHVGCAGLWEAARLTRSHDPAL